jgi:hypothetical protein
VPRNAVVSVGYLWGRVRDAYLWDFCGGSPEGLRRPAEPWHHMSVVMRS